MNNIQRGRCQCGEISYAFNANKVISAHHCHCKDCQRTTGSGKATILFIAKKYVEMNGELKFLKAKAPQAIMSSRGFCPNCGSGVLSYQKELSHIVFIKAGTLDDSSWVKVDSNFFTDSANKWNEQINQLKALKAIQALCLISRLC